MVIYTYLYGETDDIPEILLASVSNIFILEVDDYIGSLIVSISEYDFNEFNKINVYYKSYNKLNKTMTGFIFSTFIIIWSVMTYSILYLGLILQYCWYMHLF